VFVPRLGSLIHPRFVHVACLWLQYLKTTIFGMTALLPDYAAVIVGSNMGVSKMTREHIGIAAALGLPLIIVVTKIDMSPPDVHAKTMETVSKVLKQARKMPLAVRAEEQVETAARSILSDRITPVICVSAVTGEGMDLLRDLLRQLPPRISTLAAKGEALHLKVPVGNGLADKVAPAAPASAPAAATAEAAGAGAAAAGATGAAAVAGTGAAAAPTAGAAADSVADTAPRIDGSAAEAAGTATGDATAATGAAALAAASAAPAAGAGAAGAGAAPTEATASAVTAGAAAGAGAGAAGSASAHGADGPGESTIDSVFNVPGVGTVVAGTVMRGCVKTGSTMMLVRSKTRREMRLPGERPPVCRPVHLEWGWLLPSLPRLPRLRLAAIVSETDDHCFFRSVHRSSVLHSFACRAPTASATSSRSRCAASTCSTRPWTWRTRAAPRPSRCARRARRRAATSAASAAGEWRSVAVACWRVLGMVWSLIPRRHSRVQRVCVAHHAC